jgi:hypothetical protein
LSQYAVGLAFQNGLVYIGGSIVGTITGNVFTALHPGPNTDAGGTQIPFPGWAGKGIATDATGSYFVANAGTNSVIGVYTNAPFIWADFGSGYPGDMDGTWVLNIQDQPIPGAEPSFNNPTGVVVDSAENIYVADNGNYKIRKINKKGVVSTFAGNGSAGAVDGMGTAAGFAGPIALAIDGSYNVYVADGINLRKITPSGAVTTLCKCLNGAAGLAVDAAGQNFFASEFYGNVIEKISLQ